MSDDRKKRLWRPTIVLLIGLPILYVASGCNSVHYGEYPGGLADFPDRTVSPEQAVKAAEPYLDQSFALCRANRGSNWPDSEPYISVKLEGKHYKVLKDNYPYKSYSELRFSHAVKVNADTGAVTPPQ